MFFPKIVLMYHSIVSSGDDLPRDRELGADLYDVSVQDFRQHLIRIRGVCEGDISSEDRERLKRPEIILTFDDGEMNNFLHAFPLLKEFGLSAYFFVTVDRIGKPGYMGPTELQILSLAGMTVGSHGLTHRILTGLGDDELQRELTESRKTLEAILARPVISFSIPRGFYDERVLRFTREAGYREIFVSSAAPKGKGILGRTAVKGDWTMDRFDMSLRGKIPTVEIIQDFAKRVIIRILGPGGYDRLRTQMILKK